MAEQNNSTTTVIDRLTRIAQQVGYIRHCVDGSPTQPAILPKDQEALLAQMGLGALLDVLVKAFVVLQLNQRSANTTSQQVEVGYASYVVWRTTIAFEQEAFNAAAIAESVKMRELCKALV